MQVDSHEGTWESEKTFEAFTRGSSIEFDMTADGGCRIGFDIGRNSEVYSMAPEQFAAFKEWVAKT